MSIEHLYLPPGEGESVSLRGTRVVFKATGERDPGGPTVIEFVAAPGFSTGDHVHTKVEEILGIVYLTQGAYDARIPTNGGVYWLLR